MFKQRTTSRAVKVFFFFFIFLPATFASTPQLSSTTRIIDFRINYPILSLETNHSQSKKNYLGLSLQYQYFPTWVGLVADLGGWFYPFKGALGKSYILNVQTLVGPSIRPIPSFWLDPTLYLLGGISLSDAGDYTHYKINYPLGARGSISLFRQTQRFQDNALALALSGSIFRVFNQLHIVKPVYFDIGLSLRGEF